MRVRIVLVGVVVLAACSVTTTPQPVSVAPTDAPERATQIAADPELVSGQANYYLRCVHCHGYSGEGQLTTTTENTRGLGMHIVPPHNGTGHTWEHPDQLLMEVIRKGIQNPLDQYPMPAFEGVMTDKEMRQVLTYIKLWWTDEQRRYQIQLTENRTSQNQEFGLAEDS